MGEFGRLNFILSEFEKKKICFMLWGSILNSSLCRIVLLNTAFSSN